MDLTTVVMAAWCTCVGSVVGVPLVFVLLLLASGERTQ